MTVQDLIQLDIDFCEKVSKLGATSWANHFSDDGMMIITTGDPIVSEVKIYEAMKPFFEKKGNTLTWFPENGGLSNEGDLGYTYGKYIRQSIDDQNKKMIETGRYISIWRKQSNGSYKIEVDFGN